MKKLFIAEKPSLMRKISHALESSGERFSKSPDGEYYESENYIGTSQFGHLLELVPIEAYPENEGKNMWQQMNLPFFPAVHTLEVRDDCKTRYKTIDDLIHREDVEEIIHCGDPDREGQILVDLVLEKLKNEKPVTRPQLKALTDDAIIEAFRTRKPNSAYSNIRDEGYARMVIDFDYGINLSRYANIKTGAKPALNVGRVIGAIVNEIYSRDMAIKNFVPEKYYKIESDAKGLTLKSEKTFGIADRAAAENYAASLNSCDAVCTGRTVKDTVKQSPRLFSQTSLQAAMNKLYGVSPDGTLEIAQSLYEKGLISYPRTNTEYIAEAEMQDIEKIIAVHDSAGDLILKTGKRIFDDSKIDGHSAITPTTASGLEKLTETERSCYDLVMARFKAVFTSEPCIYEKVDLEITCGEEIFKVSGETRKQDGFLKYELLKDIKEKELPLLYEGSRIDTDFKALETQTSPPKAYTVETLGKWMQNPFKKREDADQEEDYESILQGLEIGTEATRAGILKKAMDKKYIELKKSTYRILPRGIFLVETCNNLGINVSKETTAEMGRVIKSISRGETDIDHALETVHENIRKVFAENRQTRADEQTEDGLGKCPKCGKQMKDRGKLYGCSGYPDCKFMIWKTVCGKNLTAAQVKKLLSGKPTQTIKGFTSKKGTKFSAKLTLKDDGSIGFIFEKK